MSAVAPAVVLVPGWGMGPSVFTRLAGRLSARAAVHCPALPAAAPGEADPGRLADELLAGAPGPAHWVGWSLGGPVALAAARRAPAAVARVTLLAAAPRMVAAPGWPAIDPGALADFRRALVDDPAGTHARFLALQARGCEHGRDTLRALRRAADTDGTPPPNDLAAGLDLLAAVDLRAAAAGVSCPIDAVLGAADALLPAAVGAPLERLGVAVRRLPGVAHAAPISHPGAVADGLLESPP